MDFPTPKNLNYWWTFGAILAVCLATQIVTGIILAMHYVPNATLAFDSVEHIMRDVNYGWLIQLIHANGASMMFLAVYIHMFRGLYYGSYKAPREVLWLLGMIIYFLMMATAFFGYVLPWGQMSFWGATVITNIFGALPVIGPSITTWLWGGFAVDDPTLNRFFSLHYLLPFVIAGVVVLHIWALHVPGNNNPTGVNVKSKADTVPFHPYYTVKDGFGSSRLPDPVRGLRLLRARRHGPRRQLCAGQPAGDARSISCRSGTSCPTTRCCGRCRTSSWACIDHVRSHRRALHAALDRHVQGALHALPADGALIFFALPLTCLVLGWCGAHEPDATVIPGVGAGFMLGDYGINTDVWLSRLGTLCYFGLLHPGAAVPAAVRDAAAGAGVDLDTGARPIPPPFPPARPPRPRRRVKA